MTIGIGAYENPDKIEEVADNINFCNVKVFYNSAKIISSLKKGSVDAIVRGTLPSSDFLNEVKNKFNIDKIYRIGLLGTYDKKYFFFAPLGIDEGENLREKEMFIEYANDLLKQFRVEPKISVLSRVKDIGRSKLVDKSIIEADALKYAVKHAQILIENAVIDSNFILAQTEFLGI